MKWWKIPSHDAPSADEGTIRAWHRKRRALYLCALVGIVLACAGLLLKDTWAGDLLLIPCVILLVVAKCLGTSCRTCPHCGYRPIISASVRSSFRSFTCERCGYTIPDLR